MHLTEPYLDKIVKVALTILMILFFILIFVTPIR
jgi:hypothetical protein